jgi:hypothetical protein
MAFDALFERYDRLVILDTETTGLNYSRDEIIEFSAVAVEKGPLGHRIVEEYDQLVSLSPGGFVPPKIQQLTGSNALNQLVERGLVATCGARFTRTARPFRAGSTVTELALDQGVLINGEKEESFAELEIELKRGFREEVQVMGFLLTQAYELVPETKSKFQRSKDLGAKK